MTVNAGICTDVSTGCGRRTAAQPKPLSNRGADRLGKSSRGVCSSLDAAGRHSPGPGGGRGGGGGGRGRGGAGGAGGGAGRGGRRPPPGPGGEGGGTGRHPPT